MKICVLIPVHNESGAIGQFIRALKEKGIIVFVVDDGSLDDSGKIAEAEGAVVTRNDRKTGKGFSLRKGFCHILKQDFTGIITMDGDGQHSVKDIDKFIEAARKNEDSIIVGNRMADATGMPFIRYLTNRFMSTLISLACRQFIADTQCGYRYIGRNILNELPLTSDAFEIETEILMKASKKGIRIYSVPVTTIYRNEKSKINPLKDTIRFFIYFVKEIFSRS